MIWKCGDKEVDLAHTRVMGIINVTPDSFSDGGSFYLSDKAVARARELVKEGADILDIGGESTRPDATPIDWETEWMRIAEPLEHMHSAFPNLPLSVDTYHAETAQRAIAAGADIINTVREPSEAMWRVLMTSACGMILPTTCREDARKCKIADDRIVVDPLIGFTETREEDLARLASIRDLAAKGPVCVGVSRKRIVRHLTGEPSCDGNVGGSVAAALWCVREGASLVRVHDVIETIQALRVYSALQSVHGGMT